MSEDLKTWTVRTRFKCGDVVYHKMTEERCRGLVTGFSVRETHVSYWVSWGDRTESHHFDSELTAEFVKEYVAEDA